MANAYEHIFTINIYIFASHVSAANDVEFVGTINKINQKVL